MLDSLRRRARAHLSLGLPARYSGLLRGVILGEKGGVENDDLEAFRRSGTAHILAVSGLHVATLSSLVLVGGSLLGMRRGATYLAAGALAVLFVPLTGAGAPVLRAATVLVLFLVSQAVGSRRDGFQLLLLAAIGALLHNPFFIWDTGFRLSFSAATALLLLTRRLQSWLDFLPGPLAAGVAVSLAATLGTAPVSLWTFGQVPLAGVLANLAVVPPLAALMGLGIASVALGFASAPAAGAFNSLAALLLSWIVQSAHLFARLPLLRPEHLFEAAVAAVGAFLGLVLAFGVLRRPPLLGCRLRFVSWLDLFARKTSPDSCSQRRLLALLLPPLLTLTLLVAAAGWSAAADELRVRLALRGWPASVEVRVLDVGQGTAVLVRTPDRGALLFDAGPRSAGLGSQLRALGVRKLDLVLLSHPHEDHFGGLSEALDLLRVDAVVEPSWVEHGRRAAAGAGPPPAWQRSSALSFEEKEASWYLDVRERLQESGARSIPVRDGSVLRVRGVQVLVRCPPESPRRGPPADPNEAGLVAVVTAEGVDILLPGDTEANTLRRYDLAPVDVLVVPHHGSKDAVTARLLGRLQPQLAVITVGADNRFGHPHSDVVADLQRVRVGTLRTDLSGWVAIRPGPEGGIEVESERGVELRHIGSRPAPGQE
jgi:competence protein ComEC